MRKLFSFLAGILLINYSGVAQDRSFELRVHAPSLSDGKVYLHYTHRYNRKIDSAF